MDATKVVGTVKVLFLLSIMGSITNPKTWVPYVNTKDCTQGFCSMYCPQWCYIIFPPPPPPFDFPDDDSSPTFSPLVIAIIGILASAFILVSYYAIISKFCRNRDPSSRRRNHFQDMELEEDRDPSNHGHWNVSTNGLDEAMIKSIAMFKYKKGDGLIEGTDCSVCLSEFLEDESLRLLPKCSHAFHVTCIDTWLKSHPNCPLCRANVVIVDAMHRELPPPVMEAPAGNEAFTHESHPENGNVEVADDTEIRVREQEIVQSDVPTTPVRAGAGLESSETSSTIIDIRDDEDHQQVRRSVSMDNPCPGRLSIADILCTTDDEDYQLEECSEIGTSRRQAREMRRSSNRNKVLHCVTSPVAMKRSFSSGRFAFSRRNRGRNTLIPL